MAGETGKKALHRLRTEGSRLKLHEIKSELADADYQVSLATLSAVGKDERTCTANLELALVKLHNRKFTKGKLMVPKAS